MKTCFLICFALVITFGSKAQSTLKLGLLKYRGGGDWYANPTSLPNLISFCNKELNLQLANTNDEVDVASNEIYNYPYLHITGHGNIIFNEQESENLRNYLIGGGFLHIDDNYGIDKFIRVAMKKVFPELDFVELPFSHPIYHQKFDFKNGLPKIHEHDGKPAQGFGLIYNGRLICFYSYETDLGDGWEDTNVHKDPIEKHIEALKMGANIIQFAFTQK